MRTLCTLAIAAAVVVATVAGRPGTAAAKAPLPLDDLEDPDPRTVAVDPGGSVIATEPEPPPARAHVSPRQSIVVVASALTARMPAGTGRLADLGLGAAVSLGCLQRRGDLPSGVVVRGMAVGSATTRVYSLDAQVIASARLDRHRIAPFVGLGLAFGSARFASDKRVAAAMALGPVGGLGLHGFVGDELYWRAELSAIGAGAAIITAGVSLGWGFGR